MTRAQPARLEKHWSGETVRKERALVVAMVPPLWSRHRARERASRGWRGMRKALRCLSTSTGGHGGS